MVRNKRQLVVLTMICLLIGATYAQSEQTEEFKKLYQYYKTHYNFYAIKDTVYTIDTEFQLPEGYRYDYSTEIDSYTDWITNFPIWHKYKHIGLWKGTKHLDATEVSRAVHLPWFGNTFTDFAIPIRLAGEYLFQLNQKDKLILAPPQGDTLTYDRWLEANPAFTYKGDIIWKDGNPKLDTEDEYYKYLIFCMQSATYAGLMKNCEPVESGQVQAGDMFIATDDTGKKGAVYVILRLIFDENDHTLFLVGTGCEEACDFHIPLLTEKRDIPWVSENLLQELTRGFETKGFYRFKFLK